MSVWDRRSNDTTFKIVIKIFIRKSIKVIKCVANSRQYNNKLYDTTVHRKKKPGTLIELVNI